MLNYALAEEIQQIVDYYGDQLAFKILDGLKWLIAEASNLSRQHKEVIDSFLKRKIANIKKKGQSY